MNNQKLLERVGKKKTVDNVSVAVTGLTTYWSMTEYNVFIALLNLFLYGFHFKLMHLYE